MRHILPYEPAQKDLAQVSGRMRRTSNVNRSLFAHLVLCLAAIHCGAAPGGVDLSFNPGSGIDGDVYAIAPLADGKLIVGGSFNTVQGPGRESRG